MLAGKASAFLIALPKGKQKKVVQLAFKLAETPFQIGDYTTKDDQGRPLENILVGEWLFTFWADHATRELRIMDIAEV
ncbi:MAG: hypothetical protein NTV51_29235 [Verrucomicrobia bacterium]|nr:hypothetical protein [Verrucomicrobiota bacterium]